MQLARGSAASVKGSATGNQAALNRALHQNRAVPVRGAAPAVRVSSGPAIGHYRFLSTEGPFQALLAEGPGLYGDVVASGERHTPGQGHRQESLRVTAGAPSSDRLVTIRISGVVEQAVVRTGEVVLRVPFRRMNEALQRAHRLGQVTSIQVS